MSKFRLEMNVEGFNEIRRSQAIQDNLHARGVRIAEAAGGAPDFEVIDDPSRSRARVIVKTATAAGREAEATERALTRGFDAGRG
nr:hypothetical protein [Microbacterium bovistercoris]